MMIRTCKISTLLTLLAAATAGCDESPEPQQSADAAFLEEESAPTALASVPDDAPRSALLAEVSLPQGGKLRFLDESGLVPGGGIGLFQVGGGRSVVAAYHELHDASPLELFMALAPDDDPPQPLWDDHVRRGADRSVGGVAGEPRILPGLDEITANLAPSLTIDMIGCDQASPSSNHADFLLIDGSLSQHGHAWDVSGVQTAVTGSSASRALGMCVKVAENTDGKINMRIEAEQAANLWFLVDSEYIDPGNAGFYSSSGWVSQRYRVKTDAGTAEVYHLEGSW